MRKFKILVATLILPALNGFADAPNDVLDRYFALTDGGKYKEAIDLMMPYAEQKDADSELKVGWAYIALDNYKEGMKWYKRAASRGNAAAQGNLGQIYYKMFDYESAYKQFESAAKSNDAYSLRMLGVIYYDPNGNTTAWRDYIKAARYFQRAADLGDATAQYYLGVCYLESRGVAQDKNKGVQWLKKAANGGNESAKELLNKMGL